MRSSARFLVEDPEGYRATLQDLGMPTQNIDLIEKFGTTMLLQNVTSQADNAAIQNEEGAELSTDYRRVPALISYQPIVLEGLQWGLIAKMDRDEVFAPFYAFQRQLLISAALIIALLAFASVAIAYLFMRPVNQLLEGARRVDDGDSAVTINLQTRDELGELATSLNGMMQDIRQQSAALEQKNQEVTHLLLNVLPSAAARRLQSGETGIIDQVQQVTLLSGRVQGLDELALRKEAQEIADLLQDLAVDLDEAADRHDVEKLSIVGQRFLGICGLSTPHLDHSRRTADFALAVAQIVDRLNTKYGANLNLRAGIHTGPVTAGVIGVNKILYEMWGETINVARALVEDAGPNMILVSQAIYERLRDQFVFRRLREAGHDTSRVGAWVLEGVATPATGQPASVAESSQPARAAVR
jgi:class 3 adenylate cyclase